MRSSFLSRWCACLKPGFKTGGLAGNFYLEGNQLAGELKSRKQRTPNVCRGGLQKV